MLHRFVLLANISFKSQCCIYSYIYSMADCEKSIISYMMYFQTYS